MTAARPGWHPRARLFATRSPVLLQNNRSRSRKDLSISSVRAMQLQAGQPEKKGNKRGAAYTYNIKELRNREIDVARHAEHAYEQFVSRWQRRGPSKRRTGAANEERR